MPNKKASFKFKIRGENWTIQLLSQADFVEQYGSKTLAITHSDTNEVVFSEEGLDLKTVRHELFHVYVSTLYIENSGISYKAMEETLAELFAEQGPQMLKDAVNVLGMLRK